MSELIVIGYDDKFTVVDEVKQYGGTVLRTSLTKEDEATLQAALDSVQQDSAKQPA
jgi:uncharacterized membrane protein